MHIIFENRCISTRWYIFWEIKYSNVINYYKDYTRHICAKIKIEGKKAPKMNSTNYNDDGLL